MTFKLKEEKTGARLEIGIYKEDKNEPTLSISGLGINKYLNEKIKQEDDPTESREIYSKALAIDILYRMIAEYNNDKKKWQDEKSNFISRLSDESYKVQ